MLSALGQSLPIAVGLAVVSIPMAVVVLMMVTAGARTSVAAFILGWLVGIGGVVALTITIVDTAVPETETSRWASIVRIVLGLVLFGLAFKQWRSRPRDGAQPTQPKWMSSAGSLSPLKSLGLALLSVANPKNSALAVSGAAAIAAGTSVVAEQAVAAVVFTVIASVGVAAPVVVNVALGDRAASVLDSAKAWMTANNAIMMTVILALLGVIVLGEGLSGLS
ncbi:GAP family protein [Rhodococcus sp. IEGM 1379]|uniref:GAP family protein n=1 Tax=Rhodococcus sp. IEGM 1379 TaxID=3047086 RepID=UPI0024B735D9|nr:GAP family protein [Rhodococcus sp. IEGM 1379]MDI9914101.1 GAP family protein [Rhodococcus sp. IEGM 1379]